ncbi:MAG: sodium:proton antiporter, partial [Chloroflexaceae bacterium]|nr:sodium:proton antiporter [Chloroflexaceae bacterium]
SVIALGWGSVLTVLTLMFVVRPISVIVCTWNSGTNWRQKFFLSWIAPKGIVSASVASLFAILLTERGVNGGDSIKALVFLTILMTVLFQGLTARWVARCLGISSAPATGAVIIGCNPLGRLIGRLLQEQGESVVLIDTDAELCKKAESENLPVFASSGLDPDVLEEAGIESMGTFIALTNNGEVNLVLAQRAMEEFSPPRVFAVFPHGSPNNSQTAKNKVNLAKISPAFLGQLPIKTWNQYLSDGQVKLGKTVLNDSGFAFQQAHFAGLIEEGELLPLLVKRDSTLKIVKAAEEWQAGDEIIFLLHDSRPKLLKRLSGGTSATRLVIEKLSEVEEVPIAASALKLPVLMKQAS